MLPYECHITIEPVIPMTLEGIKIRVEEVKWFFSCIHADPMLGQKTLCYATNHFSNESSAILMTQRVSEVLNELGCYVVRAKVEHVIFDTRSKA
jgi:hypothetical protein